MAGEKTAAEMMRALLPLLERKDDRSFLEMAQEAMREWRELLAERESSADSLLLQYDDGK